MDRDSRRLSHQKGNKIITQPNLPLSSDGDDGDQIMVGSTLYTKSQGRWLPFASGRGNINDGWHGSQKYVRILPNDFIVEDTGFDTANHFIVYDEDGRPGLRCEGLGAATGYPYTVFCMKTIPLGYKIHSAKIYADSSSGSGTAIALFYHVYRVPIDGSAILDALDTTDNGIDSNSEYVFTSGKSYLADELHYYTIKCKVTNSNQIIYGGYLRIGRNQSAETIEESGDSGEGAPLPRSGGG